MPRRSRRSLSGTLPIATLIALCAAPGSADAAPGPGRASSERFSAIGCWETTRGLTVHLDNDLFAGSAHDADYTGGIGVSWTPANQSPRSIPHRAHWHLDRLLGVSDGDCRRHVWQLGLFSLTPGTLRSNEPVLDDRPFASLVAVGTSAVWNGDSEDVALQSTLQIGALGLDVAEGVHAALHRAVDDEEPLGYQHQISAGGELTARYVLARHELLRDRVVRGETFQLKNTVAMSLGYLTEASIGWSARWGRIGSPWQAFAPELADYLPTSMPLAKSRNGGELYAFAGARLKLRAYNALAQGQFRDSRHELRASDLERGLGEAYVGVQWQPAPGWMFSYTMRVHTPELRRGDARRSLVWGGFDLSRRF